MRETEVQNRKFLVSVLTGRSKREIPARRVDSVRVEASGKNSITTRPSKLEGRMERC